jgi:NTE family protein
MSPHARIRGVALNAGVLVAWALAARAACAQLPSGPPPGAAAGAGDGAKGVAMASPPVRRPRVAVVLSGGGAKGLAHISVLRVLEEEGISADVVAGASMGALVGGLYAAGYTPAALDSIARRIDWPTYFRNGPERRFVGIERRVRGDRTLLELPLERGHVALPSAAIDGERVARLLARLTWPAQTVRDFGALPRAFVAVATDIERGEPVMLTRGSLADAMRASMSAPSVFAPVRLDGRLLVDGGISRNLPATEARALGADVVICSDVSDFLSPASALRSLVDVLSQTIAIHMNQSNAAQRRLCDLVIRPDITGLTASSFDRASEAIARGATAADAARAAIRALRVGGRSPSAAPLWADSVRVARIGLEGVAGDAARRTRSALRLPNAGWVSAARLDSAIQRVDATGLYADVHYRLDCDGTDTVAVVTATADGEDRFGVGLRYDDRSKASILLTARLRNRVGWGSTTQLDLRLGEQLGASVTLMRPRAADPRLIVGGAAELARTPLPVYASERRVAEATASVAVARVALGRQLGRAAGVLVELRAEGADAKTAIAVGDSSRRQGFASASLAFDADTRDRPDFSERGAVVHARVEWAEGGASFTQQVVQAQINAPLTRALTLQGRGAVGHASGGDAVPFHRLFRVGGAYAGPVLTEQQVTLVGLRAQQLVGTSVVRAGAGLQWAVRPSVFLVAQGDVGYAGDALTLARDRYAGGVGAAVGALTAAGPVTLSVSGTTWHARPRVELSVGRAF